MLRLPILCLVVAATLPAAWAQSEFEPETVSGAALAEEGDILSVGGRRLRLYGIDAPELGQTCRDRGGRAYDCGQASRNMLSRFVDGRTLDCTVYGSTLDGLESARCFTGDTDLGGLMVATGWAFSYRAFSDRYEAAEARAQARRSGFWEGRVERPWVWRTEQMLDG